MKPRRLCDILTVVILLIANSQQLIARNDSIYQGTQIKLDIASPVVVPAITKWQVLHFEVATNVRLKDRFYPTLELGYAGGQTSKDTLSYQGQGGFFRIGADINPLKKHPDSPHALLVGVRLGTAVQDCNHIVAADCWGEVVAGCQVCVIESKNHRGAFYMGWMGRFKFLFTRNGKSEVFIPGYGYKGNTGWGLNYYLGWRF